jgi:PAS domain S-box-containing protein
MESGDHGGHGPDPQILLFMQSGRNRDLLVEALSDRYRVETTTDVETLGTEFDCCIFDRPEFNRVAGTIQSKRETSRPVFVPFVLLVSDGSADATSDEIWDYVDDVIELPVEKAGLLSRIGNLVERRRTTVQLAEREAKLETTIRDLKLKERAMDEAPIGITIAEPGDEDDDLIYANEQFEAITGYESDVIGSDCRFLQGEETDPDTRATIRAALDARDPVSVDILNYRKNGQKFWNKLDIAPVRTTGGEVTHFVGFQADITDRKIRERRLDVLNRVLSHNLRNKMNVIEGHAALLEDEFDGSDSPKSLTEIKETAAEFTRLAETVRKIERTVTVGDEATAVIDLGDQIETILSGVEDQFPAATFDLTLPSDGPCEVAGTGLTTAIEEAIENAVKHNDTSTPVVEIQVHKRPDGWIDIEVEDNGPGIPEQEITVLEQGETSLEHGDRLGFWLVHWIVTKAGGTFSVTESEPRGTCVTLSVPAADSN